MPRNGRAFVERGEGAYRPMHVEAMGEEVLKAILKELGETEGSVGGRDSLKRKSRRRKLAPKRKERMARKSFASKQRLLYSSQLPPFAPFPTNSLLLLLLTSFLQIFAYVKRAKRVSKKRFRSHPQYRQFASCQV